MPTPKRRANETSRAKKPWREERDAESVAGSVVASLRVDVERRKPLGRTQLDLDFSPARIMRLIAWPISQDILVSQLHADFRRNIRKLIKVLNSKDAATGHFGNLA